jgi:O-antigen/teichoic acid export membrane protein
LESPLRQIVRHGSVFGVGVILSRLASVVLLPLYMRHLRPEDYGVIAIIDLTVGLLGLAAGGGIGTAATREHFQRDDAAYHDRVWWTAMAMVGLLSTLVMGWAFVLRGPLAAAVFGPTLIGGGFYLGLALVTLWFGTMLYVLESHFRVQKASTMLVVVNLLRLLANIAINVLLVVVWGLGVTGVLIGNLAAAVLAFAIQLVMFIRARGAPKMDAALIRPYWSFGWPIVAYGMMSAAMHEADRYLLRLFVDLGQVGLYSVAYQIGQGVNTLVITPFVTIWSVLIYEVAKQPDARQTYARVFKLFVYGLSLVLFLAALFARPILQLIAPPAYASAADLIPVICLAYLLFSLHEHFKVPALLARKTMSLLTPVSMAAALNVAANLILIPRFGSMGAAWASVATFGLFSLAGLVRYRRIDRYPYPLLRCTMVVLGLALSYVVYRVALRDVLSFKLEIAVAAAIWLVWAALLFGRTARELAAGGLTSMLRLRSADQV